MMVVWPGTVIGTENIDKFEEWLAENGFTAKYLTEYKTLPDYIENYGDVPNTGGRNDVLFEITGDNIGAFAVWKLQYGMRWYDDYLDSNRDNVPIKILDTYFKEVG